MGHVSIRLLFLLMLWFSATAAAAHAIVLRAIPAPNERVAGPNLTIELIFNERIDRKRSRLYIIDGIGMARPVAIEAGPADAPERILAHADLTGRSPGFYRLRWEVLALDGHVTRGDIPFQIP